MITSMMKLMIALTFLSIAGCSQKQLVSQETLLVVPPQHLLSDCKIAVVGELGDSYESAFYEVSKSYIITANNIAECNNRMKAARKYIKEASDIYGNGKRR